MESGLESGVWEGATVLTSCQLSKSLPTLQVPRKTTVVLWYGELSLLSLLSAGGTGKTRQGKEDGVWDRGS